MKPVKIFVEGRTIKTKKGDEHHSTDSPFLRDCVFKWFGQKLDLGTNFVHIGGADAYKSMSEGFRRAHDKEFQVLLIIDANGNPAARKKEIEEFRSSEKLNFDYFLFPNNTDTGEVENLLEKIATDTTLLDCYENYKNCIGKPLDIKDKIYAYIQAATGDKEAAKDKNRSFLNPHFDLNHSSLEPLRQFLDKYFSK